MTPAAQTPTRREAQVLALRQQGLSGKQIGQQLGIKPGTVKIHTNSLFLKGLTTRKPRASTWNHTKLDELLARMEAAAQDSDTAAEWLFELRNCKA